MLLTKARLNLDNNNNAGKARDYIRCTLLWLMAAAAWSISSTCVYAQSPKQVVNSEPLMRSNLSFNQLELEQQDWVLAPVAVDYALNLRDGLAVQWMDLVDRVDQVLAGDLYSEDYSQFNKSYLNISVNESWSESGEFETKFRIKTRVDLPNTKKRLRLLFDSEDETDETLEAKILNKRSNSFNNKETENGLFSNAAIQWIIHQNKKIKDSISFGVRDFPKNPFVRFRTDFNYTGLDTITLNFDNSFYFAKEEKFYLKNALTVQKKLSADRLLINRTQFYWQNEDESFESSNISSFERVLDLRRRYSVSAGVGHYRDEERHTNTNLFLRGLYSHNIYEDWLFVDFTPVVEFSSEQSYSAKPSMNIKLSVFLH